MDRHGGVTEGKNLAATHWAVHQPTLELEQHQGGVLQPLERGFHALMRP